MEMPATGPQPDPLHELIALSASHLRPAGDWISVQELQNQRASVTTGTQIDLESAAREAPPALGRLGDDGVFRPTIRGLYTARCAPTAPCASAIQAILDDFMKGLELTRVRNRQRRSLTRRDLRRHVSPDDGAIARVLEAEGGIFEPVSPGRWRGRLDRRWRCRIGAKAWCYEEADSIGAYLTVQAELAARTSRHPDPRESSSVGAGADGAPALRQRLGRWLGMTSATTIGGLAVALAISPPVANEKILIIPEISLCKLEAALVPPSPPPRVARRQLRLTPPADKEPLRRC